MAEDGMALRDWKGAIHSSFHMHPLHLGILNFIQVYVHLPNTVAAQSKA
jgi:hypothetical protein